jgi:endonuclease-3
MEDRVESLVSFDQILKKLRSSVTMMVEPVSFTLIERFGRDPYILLISCILSLRTKDAVTLAASLRLFEQGKTPESLSQISLENFQKLIYPVGFFRQKSVQIKKINKILIEKYNSKVPLAKQELLALPGVGIKTANLVLGLGFQIPALCVDIHVHRIANRLGLVATKTPEETERELTKIVPQEHWIELNRLLVMWGQNMCVPVSPYCSKCPLLNMCPRNGVTKSR